MAEFDLIPFEYEHLASGVELSQSIGWPHRYDDWEMLLPFSSGYVAMQNDRVVGTALRSDFGGVISTVNMLIVKPDLRGQGVGSALVSSILPKDDRLLRLVSTVSGRPLYEKLGFGEVARLAQHQGVIAKEPDRGGAQNAAPSDIAEIKVLENQSYGGDRSTLIGWLAGNASLAVVRQNEKVTGFAGCRRFGRGYVVGPVVAENTEDAQVLISHHLSGLIGQFVRLDVMFESGLSVWLADLGLPQVDQPPVMEKGTVSSTSQRIAVFSQALG